jgi:hypothetical protein
MAAVPLVGLFYYYICERGGDRVRLCVYAIVSESLRFYRRDKIMIFSQHESDIREKGAPHVYARMHVSAICESERESTKAAHTCAHMREKREREKTISTAA